MARKPLDEAAGLTAADVVHERFTALPPDASIAQVREWFAASSHRKLAVLADHGRYVGSLTPEDLDADLEPTKPAAEVARDGPTVGPEAAAHAAHELAIAASALRVPVVDRDGNLIGVVGVTDDLAGFCGVPLP
jgi:CBS-domain-containing membrane protein